MTTLKLVQIGDMYRGTMDLPEIKEEKKSKVHTIAIIDNSGSMSSYIKHINEMITTLYKNLGHKDTDEVDIITFNTYATHHRFAVWDINKKIKPMGMTSMQEVPSILQSIITKRGITDLRLIVLSDGAIGDSDESINNIEYFKNHMNNINLHCITVRVMSSADTKALATWMNINTAGTPEMVQITNENIYTYADMADMLYKKFIEDNLGSPTVELVTEKEILQRTPFSTRSKLINLRKGRNEFWLSDIPNTLMYEGNAVQIQVDQLNSDEYISYMSNIVDEYTQRLKILKVVNTDETRNETNQILEFFSKVDKFINSKQSDVRHLLEKPGLMARKQYLKQMALKSKKSFINNMREIANDDQITKLSSAQQAEWMQTKFINKSNAKRVAKAMEAAGGGDLDEIVKKEVRNIHQQLPVLKQRLATAGVKEEDLAVSFVSQESILDGLTALSDCVADGSIDDLNHLDLLKLVSIVGIAANGVTGAHPDPMTYRINDIYSGCFISVSDLMMVNEYNVDMDGGYNSDCSDYSDSGGVKYLTPPGMPDKKINTCVPVVHPIIFKFMKYWCHHILELSAGFGMRGFIGEIPLTNSYTIATGLWSMMFTLNKNKSELTIKTFETLKETFIIAIGKFFDHILDHIHDQDETVSYYIGNNGISNMISPIIKLNGDEKYMHRVYSALYLFEYYQKTRRLVVRRNHDRPDVERQNILYGLFNIDLDRKTPKLTPLFETDTEPNWYSAVPIELNHEKYTGEFKKEFWWIEYCVLMRDYFNGETSVSLSPEYIANKLHLDYDITTFEFFNFVAALLYPTKKSRVDDDNLKMLVAEFVGPEGYQRGMKMCRDYIIREYRNQWMSQRAQKKKDEIYKLSDDIVRKLVYTEDINEYTDLIRNGLTRGNITIEVKNPGIVFPMLKDRLLDPDIKIPLHEEKLLVFLTGRYNGNIVWNEGNPLSDRRYIYTDALKQLPHLDTERIRNAIAEMKGFAYRSGRSIEELMTINKNTDWTNRHGHGILILNGKVEVFESFYALTDGECSSLEAYKKVATAEEFDDYCEKHKGCCGIPF